MFWYISIIYDLFPIVITSGPYTDHLFHQSNSITSPFPCTASEQVLQVSSFYPQLKISSSTGLAQISQTLSEMIMLTRRALLPRKKGIASMQSNIRCHPGPINHSTVHSFLKNKVFLKGWALLSGIRAETSSHALCTLYGCDGSLRWKASFSCYLLLQNILNDKS